MEKRLSEDTSGDKRGSEDSEDLKNTCPAHDSEECGSCDYRIDKEVGIGFEINEFRKARYAFLLLV